jgi:hypothetical protein
VCTVNFETFQVQPVVPLIDLNRFQPPFRFRNDKGEPLPPPEPGPRGLRQVDRLVLFDANGGRVGPVYPSFFGVVVIRVGSHLVQFDLSTAAGLQAVAPLYYESTNCSGAPYLAYSPLFDLSDALVQWSAFITPTRTVYVADRRQLPVAVELRSGGRPGNCFPVDPNSPSTAPYAYPTIPLIDVAARFPPPYRLRVRDVDPLPAPEPGELGVRAFRRLTLLDANGIRIGPLAPHGGSVLLANEAIFKSGDYVFGMSAYSGGLAGVSRRIFFDGTDCSGSAFTFANEYNPDKRGESVSLGPGGIVYVVRPYEAPRTADIQSVFTEIDATCTATKLDPSTPVFAMDPIFNSTMFVPPFRVRSR